MNNKVVTKKAHNAIAKKYYEAYKDDKTDLPYFDKFLSLLKGKVLDLGCGMGHYSNYMYNEGFEVTGIDFSSAMIKIAKKLNSQVEFIKHDICDLNIIKKRKFDGIVIAYVLQHLSKNEVLNLFEDLNNFVKENSKLLLFLRQGDAVITEVEPMDNRYIYIINEYSKDEITDVLNASGWKVLKLEDKPSVDDPNSLAPNTLVVIAERH